VRLQTDFPFQSRKWVLVAFATKKSKKHYVGVITSVNEGHTAVEFARRVKSTSIFILPERDDISETEAEDVLTLLSEPVESRIDGMTFPVSFSGLHVCLNLCYIFDTQLVFSVARCNSLVISMSLSLFYADV
jgi:hypothetical protein